MPPLAPTPEFSESPAWAQRMFIEIAELRQAVAARAPKNYGPVMTLAEVKIDTRCDSDSAVLRWIAKWSPNARCGQGRYTRRAIEAGLEKEARTIISKSKTRKT